MKKITPCSLVVISCVKSILLGILISLFSSCTHPLEKKGTLSMRSNKHRSVLPLKSTSINDSLMPHLLAYYAKKKWIVKSNKHIQLTLPFDVHGLDCGAPDCYTTELLCSLPVLAAQITPKSFIVQVAEYGCVEQKTLGPVQFELCEQSQNFLNFYAKQLGSNLYFTKNGAVYYYVHHKKTPIRYRQFDSLLQSRYFEEATAIPYKIALLKERY